MRRPLDAGFTLVELLVSVAVIAVLLGLLAPALRMARNAGQDGVCLSNNKQIALAWILYTNDHTYFPFPLEGSIFMDWGGVDWYDLQYSGDAYSVSAADNRPINPYIGSELNERARAEIFSCPRDDGLLETHTGEPFYYQWQPEYNNQFGLPFETHQSTAEDAGESVYSVVGNSYRANEWIWAVPGRERGFQPDSINYPAGNLIRQNNTPAMVETPSRFILTGDMAPFVIGRLDEDDWPNGAAYNWWHGFQGGAICNMAFMDGSGRRIIMEPGTARTNNYTFYVTDDWHDETSFLYASFDWGVDYPDEEEEED
jgi:prepilin-type N-terminal cleavage/methylation domain-containing protein